VPAGNHGSFIHEKKYPIQDDEYNYHHASLQVHLMEGMAIYSTYFLIDVFICKVLLNIVMSQCAVF